MTEQPIKFRTMLTGLLPHRSTARLVALMLASALTEGLGLVLLVPMLAALGEGGGSPSPVAEWLTRIGAPASLGGLLALFAVLVASRAVINHARTMAAQRFEIALVDGLRARAWLALLHCDWRVLSAMRQSDNASLLITNIDRIGYGVNQALQGLATLVTLAGLGLAALAISPPIALAALAGGALVLLAYRRMRRRAALLGEQLGDAYGQVHGHLSEGLGALRVIKSFGREARAEQDAAASLAGLRRAQLAFVRDNGLGTIALHVAGSLLLALLVWLAIVRWNARPTEILPLVALFARAWPLLGTLQQSWQNWAHARSAFTATQALLAVTEAGREPGGSGAGNVVPPGLDEFITLRGAVVRFDGRALPALDIPELIFPARRITAIGGPSGAGKSTLADLLCGLISPDEGTVTVDGATLDGELRRAWRSRVAYVQQEPVLFSGTIRSNLLWADPDASEDRLRAALRDASARFVDDLPGGLDTPTGEGGRQLSGGERQRIVLARALLRDPALLILDEAASALDRENEAAIAEAIGRLRQRLTIVIIGHGGGLPALADRMVWLEKGRVTKLEEAC